MPVQRPAALVFRYDGRDSRTADTRHWSILADRDDGRLLQALRILGAHEQARIFAEACILKAETEEAPEDERGSIWEVIQDLDRRL